jgi:hypothetical protein
MSYLSFENNIIEASGNLILKSNGDTIDCCGCNLINVSNITSSGSGNSTSFNSDVAIEGNLTIDGSLIIQTGELTLIKTKDLDISDNIIGLNRGHTGGNNTSGMLINYDISNIFFGYHDGENAFVIADTSYNHDDVSRNIVLDNYVDLKVGNTTFYGDIKALYDASNMFQTIIDSSYSYIQLDHNSEYCKFGFLDPNNNVLYISNQTNMIQIKIFVEHITPYLNIGEHIGGTNASLNNYKHASNVMIEAPSFSGDLNGNAETASKINITNDTSTDSDHNIVFTSSTTTENGALKMEHGVLTYNPSKNTLTSGLFNGNVTNTSGLILTGGPNSKTFKIGENNKHVSDVVIEAPSFSALNEVSCISLSVDTINSNSNSNVIINGSFIQLNRPITSISTQIGYSNSNNEVLHITNNAGYIYLARYTGIGNSNPITPYLNIGEHIGGTNASLNNYKHASNVMIEAPSFNATSDYRTKTNIEDLDETITVSNLRPLVYIKNGKKEIGLIAHELQEVYPFMVCGEKDGEQMQSVNYNGLIGVLINDVKRLNTENDTLKSENSEIKSRLDTLEEKFNKRFE